LSNFPVPARLIVVLLARFIYSFRRLPVFSVKAAVTSCVSRGALRRPFWWRSPPGRTLRSQSFPLAAVSLFVPTPSLHDRCVPAPRSAESAPALHTGPASAVAVTAAAVTAGRPQRKGGRNPSLPPPPPSPRVAAAPPPPATPIDPDSGVTAAAAGAARSATTARPLSRPLPPSKECHGRHGPPRVGRGPQRGGVSGRGGGGRGSTPPARSCVGRHPVGSGSDTCKLQRRSRRGECRTTRGSDGGDGGQWRGRVGDGRGGRGSESGNGRRPPPRCQHPRAAAPAAVAAVTAVAVDASISGGRRGSPPPAST